MWLILLFAATLFTAIGAPAFTASSVLPPGMKHPVPLAPGLLYSIYGRHLGPEIPCQGRLPQPLGRAYPEQLCDVQVFVGDRAVELLYVAQDQINFKAPPGPPVEGPTQLRVVYRGQSHAVTMRVGLDMVVAYLKQPAHAGGPVWLCLDMPEGWEMSAQYPTSTVPSDFGCNIVDVRRNGMNLRRIQPEIPSRVAGGACGSIGALGSRPTRPARFPLHLQYRFDKPGVYEVRYSRTQRQGPQSVVESFMTSEWTRIVIGPAAKESK